MKRIDYSDMFKALDTLMLTALPQMEPYCKIGKLVSSRSEKGAAVAAAEYLGKTYPDVSGFSPRNLRRMRDFYRAYQDAPEIMATNLPKIAPLLAKGLKARVGTGREKAIIMVCENAIGRTDHLRDLIAETGLITEEELAETGAFPNVAVDRMALDGEHNGKKGIEVSDAFELAIERQKLPDPEIQAEVCAAVLEAANALERKYGFTRESLEEYLDAMMLKRFLSPGIADAIARVSREPIRKLAPNDRIMGPAYMCEEYGLKNNHLLRGAACAFLFQNPEDPQAVELQNFIAENGIDAAITKYTGAEPDSRVFAVIRDEYGKWTKA